MEEARLKAEQEMQEARLQAKKDVAYQKEFQIQQHKNIFENMYQGRAHDGKVYKKMASPKREPQWRSANAEDTRPKTRLRS